LRVATKIGSTLFWFLTSYRAAEIVPNDYFIISMKFPIDRIPSCLIFEFRDFGRIMAVGHWAKSQNWGSRVFHHHHEIFNPKSIIMPYIENLGLWPDWGVGHRRRWQWVHYKKTLLVLRPFEGAITCSILIAGTQVMLRKAYFLRKGSWFRPESWTPRTRIQNSGPYYWDAHTNGLMFKISAL
jgi:hypothetical protein